MSQDTWHPLGTHEQIGLLPEEYPGTRKAFAGDGLAAQSYIRSPSACRSAGCSA